MGCLKPFWSGFKTCGFGEWIHWFCVNERSIHLKYIRYMWFQKYPLFLGKKTIFSYPAQVLEVAVQLLHNVWNWHYAQAGPSSGDAVNT